MLQKYRIFTKKFPKNLTLKLIHGNYEIKTSVTLTVELNAIKRCRNSLYRYVSTEK